MYLGFTEYRSIFALVKKDPSYAQLWLNLVRPELFKFTPRFTVPHCFIDDKKAMNMEDSWNFHLKKMNE